MTTTQKCNTTRDQIACHAFDLYWGIPPQRRDQNEQTLEDIYEALGIATPNGAQTKMPSTSISDAARTFIVTQAKKLHDALPPDRQEEFEHHIRDIQLALNIYTVPPEEPPTAA